MKKGSQNAVILLLTISLYLLSCSSNEVDVVNVELTNSGNKIDYKDSLSWTYRYFPTDKNDIFFVERTVSYDTVKMEQSYFISPKSDTVFIGKKIRSGLLCAISDKI